MDDFGVSLCITTRNRPDDLKECLLAAGKSSIPLREIIVSDDSTDTRTRDLVLSQFPHVKFLEGPRKGLGPNRNNAIGAVTADWILFLDDDARISVDFLEKMAPLVEAGRGGKFVYSGLEVVRGEKIIPKDLDFLGFQVRSYGPDDPINTLVINATLFPAALCKELLFDPCLIYGYDEVDIALRARAAGWMIKLCPEAINFHYPSDAGRENYKAETDVSRILVIFKHYYNGQKKPFKAYVFLVISLIHNLAHHWKAGGLRGLSRTASVRHKAMQQVLAWLRERSDDSSRRDVSVSVKAPAHQAALAGVKKVGGDDASPV